MPKCSECGYEDLVTLYVKMIDDFYMGKRERVTHCIYCKNVSIKKEVI